MTNARRCLSVTIVSLLLVLWHPLRANEEDAKGTLIERLTLVNTLRASFVQRLLEDDGEELQVLKGKLHMRAPSLFRWEIETPYPMTYLLRDLDLTVVDPDLHQVTYRSLDSTEEVPVVALLLHRDMDVLDDFRVTQGRNYFRLEPLDELQLFRLITMYFKSEHIDAIDVRDSQGRLTEFSFQNVEVNVDIHEKRFVAEILEGMDVIGEKPVVEHSESNDSL